MPASSVAQKETEARQRQYNALVGHLAKRGFKPEDVPAAMKKLRKQLVADRDAINAKFAAFQANTGI